VDVIRANRIPDGGIEMMERTKKADYAVNVMSTNWWQSLDSHAHEWRHFLNMIGA
jgi:hypothetical protein